MKGPDVKKEWQDGDTCLKGVSPFREVTMGKSISNRFKPGWQQVRKPLPSVLKRDRSQTGLGRTLRKKFSRLPKKGG